MIKINKISLIAAVLSMLYLPASAVQYTVRGTNVSDGSSDQVVVDNTGAVISGGATAALGYFKTIADPSTESITTLAGDFQALGSSAFDENGGAVNGLFDIGSVINDAETETYVTDGNAKAIYLFIGNASTLGASGYVGLIDTGLAVPDVTAPAASYNSSVDYSAGNFPAPASIVYGVVSDDSVSWGPGNSTGTFQLVQVPEPSSTALLGLGSLALLLRRRR